MTNPKAVWAKNGNDQGFTLIEIIVTISIMSILFAIGAGSFRDWQIARAHEGTATSLQSSLRNAQVKAITEGYSYCVRFNTPTTYTVYRYACDDNPVKVKGPYKSDDPRVTFVNPQFVSTDGSLNTGVTFRPSGSAWSGNVTVIRPDSNKQYRIAVEGFTGRVNIQ